MSQATADAHALGASRRRLLVDAIAIGASGVAFGFVFGLAAQRAGFLPIETIAFSLIVFAGAAQFAAVGYIVGGVTWPVIVLLTALLNARHLLYSAALAPWLRDFSRSRRLAMAHFLTDESFALTIAHFTRLGRADERGYWMVALTSEFIPWNVGTVAGVLVGQEIPSPDRFGLDVVFPAAMIGLAVGLISGRREVVAALVGAGAGVVVSLGISPSVGIVAGGILGPLAGLAIPARPVGPQAAVAGPAATEPSSLPGGAVSPVDEQAIEPDPSPGP